MGVDSPLLPQANSRHNVPIVHLVVSYDAWRKIGARIFVADQSGFRLSCLGRKFNHALGAYWLDSWRSLVRLSLDYRDNREQIRTYSYRAGWISCLSLWSSFEQVQTNSNSSSINYTQVHKSSMVTRCQTSPFSKWNLSFSYYHGGSSHGVVFNLGGGRGRDSGRFADFQCQLCRLKSDGGRWWPEKELQVEGPTRMHKIKERSSLEKVWRI